MTAAERLAAVNDVRTPLVAFLVTIGAAGTLWFTARSFTLNREGHVTDRYTKAVSQLGDESSPVRVGGVYALERIGPRLSQGQDHDHLCAGRLHPGTLEGHPGAGG
jgi:hypothetical protein